MKIKSIFMFRPIFFYILPAVIDQVYKKPIIKKSYDGFTHLKLLNFYFNFLVELDAHWVLNCTLCSFGPEHDAVCTLEKSHTIKMKFWNFLFHCLVLQMRKTYNMLLTILLLTIHFSQFNCHHNFDRLHQSLCMSDPFVFVLSVIFYNWFNWSNNK